MQTKYLKTYIYHARTYYCIVTCIDVKPKQVQTCCMSMKAGYNPTLPNIYLTCMSTNMHYICIYARRSTAIHCKYAYVKQTTNEHNIMNLQDPIATNTAATASWSAELGFPGRVESHASFLRFLRFRGHAQKEQLNNKYIFTQYMHKHT